MSIWKMSSSANQPVWVGRQSREHLTTDPEEAEPGAREQVLDRPARDEVGAERANVELDRPDRLVAVGEDERAVRVGRLGDSGDVVAVARAVGDRRAADEGGSLVDRRCELLGRDRAVGLGSHVHDLRAAQLLRVGDLAHGRELVVADHDPVSATPLEGKCGDDPADTLRDRRRHRDLVGPAVEQRGEAGPCGLGALDPELPLCPVLVPAGEILLVGGADPMRKRTLGARVEVRLALEDRELAADRVADTGPGGDECLGAHDGPTTYAAATSGIRYAADGLPAGVKMPRIASSRSGLVFSTMWTSRGVIRKAEPPSISSTPSARW